MTAWRILFLALMLTACTAQSPDARIAVATNMVTAMDALETDFETQTGYEISVSSGSTGQLYAQIVQGAPFDVFLAGDQERPRLLAERGIGVAGTQHIYARGRLLLWSAYPDYFGPGGPIILEAGEYRHLAMANPDLAPYGLAAYQSLMSLGLYEALSDRIVMGANIGQTYSLIASGNAQLGFIASAQMPDTGSVWIVPDSLHDPILQDAVLLQRASENPAARAFMDYLQSEPARAILRANGYEVEG